ncbi:glycosyltransferase family 4 protein [Flavobacterium sp. ENC]|uniref:glycosyltransferase family 4 protein n=1 Tax=Flavobacterium sp. ENC TaxID=2897330 RepID=UPI001E6371BD|nr:glycosyltransferase [Flavobacterium sp. ENC]MCD0466763.1 glycosyltransferase [Flavobacterium sp. ENC]
MKFAVITHVSHTWKDNQYFGYAPYVREMNVWLKNIDELILVAPLGPKSPTLIDLPYEHDKIDFKEVPDFSLTNFKEIIKAIFKLPVIFWRVFWAMKKADHIHLRCPGNMGLIGCIVQVLFPHKEKTAKYAGNWDPQSKQPWTYKLQKYIVSNVFLTRNMKVLVYGDWKNKTKNIVPFFTATYLESEKTVVQKEPFNAGIKFAFVGSLVEGKNPLYAIKLAEQLAIKGFDVVLNVYGDGIQRDSLEAYIKNKQLENTVFLYGNQNQDTIKQALQKSHFVVLPSKSEGWPKAIAEGMFWGCLPIATKVSCVPFMLADEERGLLLEMKIEQDVLKLEKALKDESDYTLKSQKALVWSREYTLEVFEKEINKILHHEA